MRGFCSFARSQVLAVFLVLAVSSSALASGAANRPVQGQPPLSALRSARDIGAPNPDQTLHVAVSLQPGNILGLEQYADAVSDPNSPLYRQFMTPAQIGATYGAPQADIDAVVAHLKANGFTVTLVAANHMSILADGKVSQAEAAFGTKIRNFTAMSPARNEAWTFYANNGQITMPSAIAGKVVDVSGLESYTRPVPRATTTKLTPALVRGLYGTGQFYVNPSLAGQGRTIGISNWDGFKLTNADAFISAYGLPYPAAGKHSNVTVVKIDGGSMHGNAAGEGDLDIQMVLAMAPLANVRVYDGKGGDLVNVLTTEANDSSVEIISESYGWSVPASTATAAHNQHLAMTASGKTYMAASGDSGTTIEPYSYPNYDPEVLQIGGTVATVDSSTGARVSEVGWSGSGGGWSNNTATFNIKPSWQTVTYPGVSVNKRWGPDVGLHSDGGGTGGYYFYYRGLLYTGSGTSFASPIYAGSLGLAVQKMLANGNVHLGGNPHLGRLQDWIYSHSSTSGLFYDITSGNNGSLPNGVSSNAVAGWDFIAGFGAMNFNTLVNSY